MLLLKSDQEKEHLRGGMRITYVQVAAQAN